MRALKYRSLTDVLTNNHDLSVDFLERERSAFKESHRQFVKERFIVGQRYIIVGCQTMSKLCIRKTIGSIYVNKSLMISNFLFDVSFPCSHNYNLSGSLILLALLLTQLIVIVRIFGNPLERSNVSLCPSNSEWISKEIRL